MEPEHGLEARHSVPDVDALGGMQLIRNAVGRCRAGQTSKAYIQAHCGRSSVCTGVWRKRMIESRQAIFSRELLSKVEAHRGNPLRLRRAIPDSPIKPIPVAISPSVPGSGVTIVSPCTSPCSSL